MGESVRLEGQNGEVLRANYHEEEVKVLLLNGNGVKVIDLNRFYDNWTGKYWDVPSELSDGVEEERRDVQIFFDWCLAGTHPGVKPLPNLLRLRRLQFLAKYLYIDDPRLDELKEFRQRIGR
jgi:hypothetical protein